MQTKMVLRAMLIFLCVVQGLSATTDLSFYDVSVTERPLFTIYELPVYLMGEDVDFAFPNTGGKGVFSCTTSLAGFTFVPNGETCILQGTYSNDEDSTLYGFFMMENAAGVHGMNYVRLDFLVPATLAPDFQLLQLSSVRDREIREELINVGGESLKFCGFTGGQPPVGLSVAMDKWRTTCVLEGVPTSQLVSEVFSFGVQGVNHAGSSLASVTMLVSHEPPPALVTPEPQSLLTDEPFELMLENSGGVSIFRCKSQPNLPNGIDVQPSDDGETCVVSGVPRSPEPRNTYTIKAQNQRGRNVGVGIVELELGVELGVAQLEVIGVKARILRSRWSQAASAHHYNLYVSRDQSPYSLLATVNAADELRYDHVVHLPDYLYASYMLETCYDKPGRDCATPSTVEVTRDMLKDAIGLILPAYGHVSAVNQFGSNLALSADGRFLFVGDAADDTRDISMLGILTPANFPPPVTEQSDENSGAIYLYQHDGAGDWNLQYMFKSGSRGVSANAAGTSFSTRVLYMNQYHISYYDKLETGWAHMGYVLHDESSQWSGFGYLHQMSRDGLLLIAGAVRSSSEVQDGEYYGPSLFFYTRADVGENFNLQQRVDVLDGQQIELVTHSAISISDDNKRIVVGYPNLDSYTSGINGVPAETGKSNSGGAFVLFYDQYTQEWYIHTTLSANVLCNNAHFGFSVSISADGTTVAVGAPDQRADSGGINPSEEECGGITTNAGTGYLYAFDEGQGAWQTEVVLKTPNQGPYFNRAFGTSMALIADGSTVIVGARSEVSQVYGISDTFPESPILDYYIGAVFVFKKNGPKNWNYSRLLQPATNEREYLGKVVCISDDGDLIVSGSGDDNYIALF